MSVQSRARILCGSCFIVCASILPAQADLSIAKAPTSNVSCSGGSCVAMAPTAVLNVADLRHLLAKQPAVSVDAAVAKNITVDSALTWTSTASLALTASGSLTVNTPVTVAGPGSLTIQTADFGLSFAHKASISFWDLSSALTINTVAYMLAGDVKTLGSDYYKGATAIALANDYDASADDWYDTPIGYMGRNGHLEGLGHTISHLRVGWSGLIGKLDGATLVNLHLANSFVVGGDVSGGVVGENNGVIDHVSVTGTVNGGEGNEIGGLVGQNDFGGTIRNSWAKVKIPLGGYTQTGGLVAVNGGTISNSWTDGTVRGWMATGEQGGLVGRNVGTIENSYSLADTRFCAGCKFETAHGGLLGETRSSPNYPSKVVSSYAAGKTAPPPGPWRWTSACSGVVINLAGAVVGCDGDASSFSSTYWVTNSSRHNPKQAAGNKGQLAGATGLTEAQLKAALPAGFDPTIWGQSPNINNGYPYLLANPPQ